MLATSFCGAVASKQRQLEAWSKAMDILAMADRVMLMARWFTRDMPWMRETTSTLASCARVIRCEVNHCPTFKKPMRPCVKGRKPQCKRSSAEFGSLQFDALLPVSETNRPQEHRIASVRKRAASHYRQCIWQGLGRTLNTRWGRYSEAVDFVGPGGFEHPTSTKSRWRASFEGLFETLF